ncbi:hypothetical protein ARMGADRAFT_1123748 [Armillaria gallica]|uniref:Uncharacterized protein n=1 Tax=Armillaria gallica TaxID=47427 RepID=A0A2H3CUM9_ARMGA|nr:hypothetical protein ARMGADRAFT_1123748 [Armillaria gallica]
MAQADIDVSIDACCPSRASAGIFTLVALRRRRGILVYASTERDEKRMRKCGADPATQYSHAAIMLTSESVTLQPKHPYGCKVLNGGRDTVRSIHGRHTAEDIPPWLIGHGSISSRKECRRTLLEEEASTRMSSVFERRRLILTLSMALLLRLPDKPALKIEERSTLVFALLRDDFEFDTGVCNSCGAGDTGETSLRGPFFVYVRCQGSAVTSYGEGSANGNIYGESLGYPALGSGQPNLCYDAQESTLLWGDPPSMPGMGTASARSRTAFSIENRPRWLRVEDTAIFGRESGHGEYAWNERCQ